MIEKVWELARRSSLISLKNKAFSAILKTTGLKMVGQWWVKREW
jgi:hypothetical protein